MALELSDIYLASIITTIVINLEIANYFLYLYFRHRRQKLGLNKILLAYGIFFNTVSFSYIFMALNSFYIKDPLQSEIFDKIQDLPVLIGVAIFLVPFLTESFKKIMNPILTKIVAIVSLFPPIVLIIFPASSAVYHFFLLTEIIPIIFFIVLQLRLIKLTKGGIRRRIALFFVGMVIASIGIVMSGESMSRVFFGDLAGLFRIVGYAITNTGLLIFFVGLFRFPAFLEFDWEKNLLNLYIIDDKGKSALYACDFSVIMDKKNLNEQDVTPPKKTQDLFSSGIVGIDSIYAAITNSKSERIGKIEHSDSIILLEYGDEPIQFITYALVARKEMISIRFFLKSVKKKFQNTYQNILVSLDKLRDEVELVFSSFDYDIVELLEN